MGLDESLLTPSTAFDPAAFLASGVSLGASDDGFEISYSPEFQEHEFAGVPGNIKGGRRLVSATVEASGSLVEYHPETWEMFIPNLQTSAWQTTETTPTVLGSIYEINPFLMDSDYNDNIAIVGERSDNGVGIIIFLYNALNIGDFSLSLNGDEDRSASELTLTASYGANTYDASTGTFTVPFKVYEAAPTVPA